MGYEVSQLLKMSQAELDALFTASEAGPIPDGQATAPPSSLQATFSDEIARFIRFFAWQGKVFDAKAGLRTASPFGINAIVAKVYKAPSWLDNKECIVLDYSETSMVAQWIRDEIRLIAPNVYLGKVYWNKSRQIDFALEFQPCRAGMTPGAFHGAGVAGGSGVPAPARHHEQRPGVPIRERSAVRRFQNSTSRASSSGRPDAHAAALLAASERAPSSSRTATGL
jgi:hypothetical protein